MDCPHCRHSNPPTATRCAKCDTALGIDKETLVATLTPPTGTNLGTTPPTAQTVTETTGIASGWSHPAPTPAEMIATLAALKPGTVLGNRYEILQQLGEGGMGAVYKARDRELDRLVALKVIRPELAGRAEILQRFKQELILARQVTHRNVVRIFDLGEADGIKFITMEFVEGKDLRSLLAEKGPLTPAEAVGIIRQVCLALEAAHAEGVVHRDLKPQNIMLDKQGRVTVMDFGIARSIEMGGMTQSGALVGTPEYMSPEQVRGEEVDARSDVFALGLIFYELLTAKLPYKADTAMATMFKRTQERAVPPAQVNTGIPLFLSDVVAKCLEIDLKRRYQSVREILNDLDKFVGGTATVAVPVQRWLPALASPKWMAAALAVALVVVIAVVFREKLPFLSSSKPGAPGQSVSLAILPFRNVSGDPSMGWLGSGLADMLRTDIGQSRSLRTASPDRIYQILRDLRISPDTGLDPPTLRRIADFTNSDHLLWGQYVKVGDVIRIDATLEDLKHQRSIALKVEAPSEKELLKAVDQLAQSIHSNLALPAATVRELRATAFAPSSQSVGALKDYNEGVALARQGNLQEALKRFETSIKQDPNFALAYSKLGQTYAALGYDKQAEQYSGKAVDLSDSLPAPERLLIQANQARLTGNLDKAIEAYADLAKSAPEDAEINFQLASLYEGKGAFDQAHDHYAKVLASDPKYVAALFGAGAVEIRRQNPQGALDYLNRALSLAIELNNEEEKGRILNAIGICYKKLGKPEEALRNYQEALAIRRRLGQKSGIALTLGEMAWVNNSLGRVDAALAFYKEALQIQREITDKKGLGVTLINLGMFYFDRSAYNEALQNFKDALKIELELGNKNYEGLCLNNIGIIYLSKGNYDEALPYFERALAIREKLQVPGDLAMTLHNLAETSLRVGQYDQALGYYLRALESSRAAGDKRMIAHSSYGLGTLYEYQGRYGAALSSMEDALKIYRELQDRGYWFGEILSGYGHSLSQVGRYEEAQKTLEEALNLARELKNQVLIAQTLSFQGDSFVYRGDLRAARPLYEHASQVASRTTDRHLILVSKLNLAKLAVSEHRGQSALGTLKTLAREADSLRLKYLSTECSIYAGQALVEAKDYKQARQELEPALRKSEDLGLRALQARAHYLLGKASAATGNKADATRHFKEAAKLLDEMRKEAGNEALAKREDLKAIAEETSRPS